MAKLQLANYHKGEGKSSYDQLAYDATSNLEVHAKLGTVTAQVALASESATPNEATISEVLPNGDSFWASTSSGKIWKRTAVGTYSLVHTNGQGANKGIRYFNGYLYYMTAAKLGRITEALASSESSWSSQNDSYATFTNGSSYKPVTICNLSMFIGDGKYVSRVDSGHVFDANVLDVESQFSVTALENADGWLLIGLTVSTSVCFSKILLWDTYSSSWTYEDDLYEIGINAFIRADDLIFISAGIVGNLYYWSGARAVKFKKIRNVTTSINPYNVAILNGRSLFAIDTKVYSVYREDKDLPYAVVEEFTVPSGTIASMTVKGSSLLVSNGAAVYATGTNKAEATFTSPIIEGSFDQVDLPYETLNGQTVELETNCNGAGWVSATFTNDSTNMRYQTTEGVPFDGEIRFFQIRFTLNVTTTSAPVVKPAIINQK
jgi:hypothetical protein